MWTDASLADVAGEIHSGAVLAAVRNATAGMPVGEGACAPFSDGRWLFSHNGRVSGWPGSLGRLASTLPVEDLITLDAPTDAALLWALVRHRLRAGACAADAVASVVTEVAAAAPQSRLNLLLTDGQTVVGTDLDPRPVDPPQPRPRSRSAPSRGTPTTTPGSRSRTAPWSWPPRRAFPPVHSTTEDGHDHSSSRCLPHRRRRRQGATSRRPAGLTATPKWLPPKWFYDARGSELFEDITRLEEYYPTRAEREILQRYAGEIASRSAAHTLVELGSGSSEKTRLLLDALRSNGTLRQFVPLDVSESALREAVEAIARDYPGLGHPRRRRGLHRAPLPHARRGPPPRGVPRWHDRQPLPARAGHVPHRGSSRCWSPASGCCWAPTWSRTPRPSSAPTTTVRA